MINKKEDEIKNNVLIINDDDYWASSVSDLLEYHNVRFYIKRNFNLVKKYNFIVCFLDYGELNSEENLINFSNAKNIKHKYIISGLFGMIKKDVIENLGWTLPKNIKFCELNDIDKIILELVNKK